MKNLGRKHFSCDGSIELVNHVPKSMIEFVENPKYLPSGDTAKAQI